MDMTLMSFLIGQGGSHVDDTCTKGLQSPEQETVARLKGQLIQIYSICFLTLISVYHSFFHVPPFRLLWLTLFTNVLYQLLLRV